MLSKAFYSLGTLFLGPALVFSVIQYWGSTSAVSYGGVDVTVYAYIAISAGLSLWFYAMSWAFRKKTAPVEERETSE